MGDGGLDALSKVSCTVAFKGLETFLVKIRRCVGCPMQIRALVKVRKNERKGEELVSYHISLF